MADKKDLSLLPSQPSLQELCEKKSLSLVLQSDFAASEFAALEPRLQELLFSKLRTESVRLSKIEKQWCQLIKCCPHIDIQIHLNPARIELGKEEDEENGYNKRGVIWKKWSYFDEDDNDNQSEGIDVTSNRKIACDTRWQDSDLVCESPESDLRLCTHFPAPCSCPSGWLNGFSFRISSQLLLYRLTVIFGMPPPIELDGYKTCWETTLKHRDGASILFFQDYKGSADARFRGTASASVDALTLLNFLIGMNCPHTYDGIVAGTMA